jgi:hypothetical protein
VSEPTARTGDWRLVAPAYSWDPSGTPAPRATLPVVQKYESSNFVTDFLAHPDESLPFDECDWVYRTESSPSAVTSGKRRSKLTDWKLTRTSTRKLFLPTHKRFYLVVCELHCEEAGFPNSDRNAVCEAAFVVRRRRVVFAQSAARDASRLVRRATSSRSQLEALAERYYGTGTALAEPRVGEFEAAIDVARAARADLLDWAERVGAVSIVEGWFPTERDKIGNWRSVKERPGKIAEATFPLYPLIPDPADPRNPAQGRAVWYGVVPTASADHDERGAARFDDRSLYEIRCYVRRHDPRCPRKLEHPDCRGPLTWSGPTAAFQLASHQDLVGTSNHPVTIQMPDIPALVAQASAMPRNQVAPVKFVTPPGSSLHFDANGGVPATGKLGGASICSFSIPLITIVATFVLNIFLPIVVFIFGLFALLRLKFCIPPSFQLNAELSTALSVAPPGADIDADVNVTKAISDLFDATLGKPAGANATAGFSNSALVALIDELTKPPATAGGAKGGGGAAGAASGAPGVSGSACAVLDGDTP